MKSETKKKTFVEPIPFHSIKADTVVDFDLYLKQESAFSKVLSSGEFYSSQLCESLCPEDESASLFINHRAKENYLSYIEAYLKEVIHDTSIPLKGRSKALYTSTSMVLENLFNDPNSGDNVSRVKNVVENTISHILSDETSLRSLMEVGSYDYYTYTHSVDVGAYAVSFGNHLGFSNDELRKLGYAAMMHDIGKSRVDDAITNKKGKLTDEEFAQMKRHPVFSCEILQEHGESDPDILKGVRHHHEKVNGLGYPDRLSADSIHQFARMIAISDVFSALSTKRSYKEAYSSFESLQLMKSRMSDDLDNNLLYEFIQFMGKSCL